MAEYIERDRFIHHLEMCIDNVRNTNGFTEDFEICLRALKNQPTADVAEVKHGKWIEFDPRNKMAVKCSNCNYAFSRLEPKNYCPNCGAKNE